jgi:hypothetical protein
MTDKISGAENAGLELEGQKFSGWKMQDKKFSSENGDSMKQLLSSIANHVINNDQQRNDSIWAVSVGFVQVKIATENYSPKGQGFVYVHSNTLYKQVKKHCSISYLKLCIEACDGSARLDNGSLTVGVR